MELMVYISITKIQFYYIANKTILIQLMGCIKFKFDWWAVLNINSANFNLCSIWNIYLISYHQRIRKIANISKWNKYRI